MKKINLTEYGRDMIRYQIAPEHLDRLQLELAGWYGTYAEELTTLELRKASFWEKHKDIESKKPKSDPFLRALWLMTEDGKRMLELDRTLKTIHILISSIKASLNRQSVEMRNQA